MDFVIPGEYVYRGVVYGFLNTYVNIDMMNKWNSKPSDILISTTQKSGTTWIGEIIRHMRVYHQEWNGNGPKATTLLPFLELSYPNMPSAFECQNEMPSPRIIKTHLPYEFTKQKVEQEGLKVVVMLREPKDLLVSFYHHYCTNIYNFPGDFHDFFELFRQNRLRGGNIFEISRDWWQKRHLPNVLVLKYEELKKDASEVVQRVGAFLEIPLNKEAIENILKQSNMENMRQAMSAALEEKKIDIVEPDKFFRKGIIGDWANHMTPEEVEFVNDKIREYYDPIGLHFDK